MFDYIKGVLTNKNYPYCTVECNNIGYNILINNRTLAKLGDINSDIKIYLKLIHKEDLMSLCGFIKKEDRVIFDILTFTISSGHTLSLTSVSGIGTKAAFALLDEFETSELISLVVEENAKVISRTKGIGAKMAQKIVLELKDKLTKIDVNAQILTAKSSSSTVSNETIAQAGTILQSLGYNQNEYSSALETAITQLKKDDAQELLKETLKILSVF